MPCCLHGRCKERPEALRKCSTMSIPQKKPLQQFSSRKYQLHVPMISCGVSHCLPLKQVSCCKQISMRGGRASGCARPSLHAAANRVAPRIQPAH